MKEKNLFFLQFLISLDKKKSTNIELKWKIEKWKRKNSFFSFNKNIREIIYYIKTSDYDDCWETAG